MRVWALSDPHLSFSTDKPMHVFGEQWRRHWEKIAAAWNSHVGPQDAVLVPGDVSWARTLGHALKDLQWLDRLPGRAKLLVRGNHDAWWPKTPKEREQIPPTLVLLEGSAVEIQGQIFCGTGGWLSPQDPYFEPLDRTPYTRELAALESALESAMSAFTKAVPPTQPVVHVLIHFSPRTSKGQTTAFETLLKKYPVATVTYGHFHLPEEWQAAPQGKLDGIHYTLASADFINFLPVAIPTTPPPPQTDGG